VRGSLDTAKWIAQQGVKLQPGLGRQAYQVDGKFKFWGGLALHIWGGGPELLNALYANVERRGIPILYETPATSLIRENGRLASLKPGSSPSMSVASSNISATPTQKLQSGR
jgi:tricarballylate dehydrogenase